MFVPDDIEILLKDTDIARLREQLQNLMRGKFGRSIEKLSTEQLSLFKQQLEDLVQAVDEHHEEFGTSDSLTIADKNALGKKNGRGGRKPINAAVKRTKRHYFPRR